MNCNPRDQRAFTIIESLVVLVVLAILSWLSLALIKHNLEPGLPAHLERTPSESVSPSSTP